MQAEKQLHLSAITAVSRATGRDDISTEVRHYLLFLLYSDLSLTLGHIKGSLGRSLMGDWY